MAGRQLVKAQKYSAPDGAEIGIITSGGFGPSIGGPVAMGYVSAEFSKADTDVLAGSPRQAFASESATAAIRSP